MTPPAHPSSSVQAKSLLFLVVAAVVTIGLPHVPYARYLVWPLMLLSTVAHELGHGIAALLCGGSFDSLEIYSDGSGVAFTAHSGRFQQAFVSAGGLVGPAFASLVLFALGRRERHARIGLGVLAVAFSFALIFFIRNWFGFVFVTGLVLVLFALVRWSSDGVARFSLVFVATNLAVSVFTRGDYLFMEHAQTAQGLRPSDVANIADALFLPYWFWGALCGAVSGLALVLGLWIYLRAGKDPAENTKRLAKNGD